MPRVGVEVIDGFGAVFVRHTAVEIGDVVRGDVEKHLQDLEEPHIVREDEDFVPVGVPESKQLLEDLPFAAKFRFGVVENRVAGSVELSPLLRTVGSPLWGIRTARWLLSF